jgi:hypothetical protein
VCNTIIRTQVAVCSVFKYMVRNIVIERERGRERNKQVIVSEHQIHVAVLRACN